MRIDDLLALLATERLKRPKAPTVTASKGSLSSMLYMGIADKDIIEILIPKIVDLEISETYSKDALKKFIEGNKAIEILPAPVRHALDGSPEQRRMDSLSRLLSLNTAYTPCVAVAFYKGELIVSSNSPKEGMTDDRLADCLATKMGLIQQFLRDLIKGIPSGSQSHTQKIKFSIRAKILATETVMKIMDPSTGGAGDVVPTTKENRHKNRLNTVEHMRNALLKIGQHCLLGVCTNGKLGFNLLELNALLADSVTIVTPNTKVLEGKQLHAEQSILYYLNEYTDFNRSSKAEKVNIGISKLCCQACHHVLNRNDKVSYRGSHGMKFPGVYDIDTEAEFEGTKTKLGADLCPSDSDSDCDITARDDDDDVPTVEELLGASSSKNAMGKQMLFKPCRAEASAAAAEVSAPLVL